MKNKIIMMLTFLATVGLIGNAFAGRVDPFKSYLYTGTPVMSAIPKEKPVPIKMGGVWVKPITKVPVNTMVPIGMASFKKGFGGINQDNIGVVTSINPRNNVIVLENKHCPKTSIVSTDDETFASIHVGQTVYAKMNNMYGNRAEIVGFGR